MKKILFTYGFEDGKLEERINTLEQLGYEVFYEDERNFRYRDYMNEIDVLVTHNVFKGVNLERFPKLKWIQLTSMGFEQVPKKEVLERKIIVTNNKKGYSIPMGEWIVLNILEMMKNRKSIYKNQEDKRWFMDFSVEEVYEKTIAFIGTGDIAMESVKRLKGFGVNLLGVNTDGRSIQGFDQCFPLEKIDSVLERSDVVISTLPNTEKTHHLIDKAKLEKMKEDGYLINVSRGAIINEEDLIRHLQEGKLKGVALDVFENEPLSKSSQLWDINRVIISSHNSWISENIGARRWDLFHENFKRYIVDEELLNQVQIKRGY